RVRRLGFRTLPLGDRLDSRLRSRQLRTGRRALPPNQRPERQRTRNADGRCLRQGAWLVSEEGVIVIPGWSLGKRKGLAALASANPSSSMVGGAGFEPAPFGL